MDELVTKLPRNKFVKECLQQGIVRANEKSLEICNKKRVTKQKTKKPSKPPSQNGTVLLSGILEEDHQSSSDKVTEDDPADKRLCSN